MPGPLRGLRAKTASTDGGVLEAVANPSRQFDPEVAMGSGRRDNQPMRHRIRWWLALATIVLAALVAYWPCLDNAFAYDDVHAIEGNARIQLPFDWKHAKERAVTTTGALRGHFRPLPMLSFRANYLIGKLNPRGYRATNLLMHFGCIVLVALIVRRLLQAFLLSEARESLAFTASIVAAAAFALHPVHSASILMVWKRTTLLSGLAYLIAVLAFLRLRGLGGPAQSKGASRLVLQVVPIFSLAFGLASKEIAVTLPATLLVLELWPATHRAEPKRLSALLWHLPLWVLTALQLTLFFPKSLTAAAELGPWSYLLVQAKAIWLYLAMIPAPNLISAGYNLAAPESLADLPVILGGLGILLLIGLALLKRKTWPLVSVAILWFFITLSPTSSFVPGPLLVDEDRTFLPFVAVWMLMGLAVARLYPLRPKLVTICIGAALLGATFFTVARGVVWQDPIWLWRDALVRYPNSEIAQANLCGRLSQLKETAEEAIRVCAEATRRNPRNLWAMTAFAGALARTGRVEEAQQLVTAQLALYPKNIPLLIVAGHIAWVRDDLAAAISYYERTLALDPLNEQALLYSAKSLAESGRPALAKAALSKLRHRTLVNETDRKLLQALRRQFRGPSPIAD